MEGEKKEEESGSAMELWSFNSVAKFLLPGNVRIFFPFLLRLLNPLSLFLASFDSILVKS